MPSPTLDDPPLRPVDEDEQVTPPTLDHNTSPTTPPDTANVWAAPPLYVATPMPLPEVTPEPVSVPTPHLRITIRLPGRGMNRTVAPTARTQDDPIDIDDEDADGAANEDAVPPVRPIHDILYVPSYPSKSTCSGLIRNGGGGKSAMLILDEEAHPPIAFSAGLPGGIQLSQMPDPRSVREAMASPDADGWKDAMDQEIANLKSHNVYELVPRTNGMWTLKLGWVFHRKFKNGVF